MSARTLLDKIWEAHLVLEETAEHPAVLYVDLHLIHEVTSAQAFAVLRERGLAVRRPERTLGTMDHATPTRPGATLAGIEVDDVAGLQMRSLLDSCAEFGIELFALGSESRGIVHVIGPELGVSRPGMTIVCGDSHTSTHGALGALAFGIGTTEVSHVLASQCLLQRKPKSLAITVNGALGRGVTAKDLVLAIIDRIGVAGGTGHVIEYRGSTIEALPIEARMTVCNMSIEAGARAGMIAPDQKTIEYLRDRPRAPRGEAFERAAEYWLSLPSDPGAAHEGEVCIDADRLEPMITWGTHPGMVMPIGGRIPEARGDPLRERALRYMGLAGGERLLGRPIDVVFLGSCTNARLSDLRMAAELLRGRCIAEGVRMLVVPGSQSVKRAAEAEGLAGVFTAAGAEWRESGCSMCLGMNDDRVERGSYTLSTSNRNFEGRQGPGVRTLLASPLTAAASALRGRVTDPREVMA